MKRTPSILLLTGLTATIFVIVSLSFLLLSTPKTALGQAPLPQNGWTVCQDLGIGPVPGQGSLQRLRMCGSDYEVDTYCLQPALPAPAVGTMCSMVNGTDFWCGDTVQIMRLYQIVATPQPPTATPPPTATQPPAPTATTVPPAPQETPNVQPTATVVAAQSTPFVRPSPGGKSYLGLTLTMTAGAAGLLLLGISLVLRRK